MRLPLRLFLAFAAVALTGAAVTYLTVGLVAPALFDHRLGMMGGLRPDAGAGAGAGLRDAFRSALNTALLVGVAASSAAAGLLAWFVSRRLARPLDAVRTATRRIAAGDYQVTVPVPAEPELAALAADVSTLGSALAATEARRTRLLGDVAHEMRTPLTALDGYVEGLIDGVFTPAPDLLNALSDELRRLHRLSDDLASLSRAQEPGPVLRRSPADLAELTRRTAARLAPQFDDAGVELTVHARRPVPLEIDPDRIAAVLTNLLGNALVATGAGGRVDVTARPAGGGGEVVVTDTGAGIPRPDLDRIFERFYRVPGATRRSSGSGIGLTIARAFARAHGGDVTASSEGPGRGARFVLTLPPAPTGTSGRPAEPADAPGSAG